MGYFLMLCSLKVKDLAIIDEIDIDFEKGLNVITGETGAGKTILLNSILLLLGKKINVKEIIRHGSEKSIIEAMFYIDNDELVVRRIISADGRNKCYFNEQLTTINNLKRNLSKFIEFSGQNQNQVLFKKDMQLKFLDIFGNLYNLLGTYKELYDKYKKLDKKIKQFEKEKDEIKDKIEIYRYNLSQLENANFQDIDEEKNLIKEIELAENVEEVKNTLKTGYYELSEKDNSILKKVVSLKNSFESISNFKESFNEITNILEEVEISLEEISKNLLSELTVVADEHFSLDSLYDRLNLIKKLKKRFQKDSIENLIKYRDELRAKLEESEEFTFDIEKIKKEKSDIEKELDKLSEKIRQKRLKTKKIFEKEVEKHLEQLKMEKINFKILFTELQNFTEFGKDEVEFLIATNKGEPLKPINKVVSGGELSRIMLAFKTILSDYLDIPILIFDEVDSGTGGETAYAIGKKLKEIAKKHQVFVITHLPQVAAFADTHFKIEKSIIDGRVSSNIRKLSYNEQVKELARMISGDTITNKSIENAEEMLKSTVDVFSYEFTD